MKKLSKAQQEAWDKIRHFVVGSPNELQPGCYMPDKEYKGAGDYTWSPHKIYGGVFNTATLKVLEKKGYIKILEIGGAQCSDVVEITMPYEQDKETMIKLYDSQANLKR